MALPPNRSGYRGNAQRGWLFRDISCLDPRCDCSRQTQGHFNSLLDSNKKLKQTFLSSGADRMALASPWRNKRICKLQNRPASSCSSCNLALDHRPVSNWSKEICAFHRAPGRGPPNPALLSRSSHAGGQRA